MERLEIEAVYENGTLKLPRELPLQEGQKVTITIHPTSGAVRRRRALIQWKGSQEDLDYLTLSADKGHTGTLSDGPARQEHGSRRGGVTNAALGGATAVR